jgi:hypothetical protein
MLRKFMPSPLLDRSVIVVAHPDDEILWFSSIVNRVDLIVFCFLESVLCPHCSDGRKQALSIYPFRNIACLELCESEVFSDANFDDPEATEYGMRTLAASPIIEKYQQNFVQMKALLRVKLAGFRNVFTHNPWGEYGNEEHVQVYEAIKQLQEEMGFMLWFTNYCSNKSSKFMVKCISNLSYRYETYKTLNYIYNYIMTIYKQNECWTWYDDWIAFKDETFITQHILSCNANNHGHIFPLNIFRVEPYNK